MAFTFASMVAWDPVGKAAVKNVSFQAYAITDTAFTTPLTVTDPFGAAIPGNILNSGTQGVFIQFQHATLDTVVIADSTKTYTWTVPAIQQDQAVANYINRTGSATQTALNATYAPIAHVSNTSNPHAVTKAQVGLGSVDNTADTAKPVSTAQATAIALKLDASQKGSASGVASLDSGTKIPIAQVPDLSGTYATKRLNVLNARDYGAIPDLSTDIVGPINAALAALGSAPGVVIIPPGQYLANSTQSINLNAGQSLWAEPGTVLIRVRNSGVYGTIRSYSSDSSWTTTVATLTANAAVSDRTLTIDSTAGLTAGQYFAIATSAKAFGGGSSVNANQGEFIKIKSIDSGTQVTLYNGLRDSYLTSDTAVIRNPNLQAGISIHGLTIEAETPASWKNTLIEMGHTISLKISQVRVQNSGGAGITVRQSVGFTIQATANNLMDDDTNGYFGYAVNAFCMTEQGEVDIVADQVRHAFTTTEAAGEPGYPCDIVVTGAASRCQLTGGFDTHAAARGIVFKNVRVFDCGIGIQVRSPYTRVISPSIEGCSLGVLLTANFGHSIISDAEIRRTYSRSVAISNQGHGVVILTASGTGGGYLKDVVVKNSTIDTLNGSGIYIAAPTGGAAAPADVRVRSVEVIDGQTASQGGTLITNSGALNVNANITDLNVDGLSARNRSGIGALSTVVYVPSTGVTANGSFARLYKDGPVTFLSNVTNGGFRPTGFVGDFSDVADNPPNSGRGGRAGSGLWYSPNGGVSTATLSNGVLTAVPFDVSRPMRVTDVSVDVTVAGSAGSVIRIGIYQDDGTGLFPLAGGAGLLADCGTVDSTGTGALTLNLGTSIGKNIYLNNPGRYWLAAVGQGAPSTGPTVRVLASNDGRLPQSAAGSNTTPALGVQNSASVTGALPGWSSTYGTTAVPPVVQIKMD